MGNWQYIKYVFLSNFLVILAIMQKVLTFFYFKVRGIKEWRNIFYYKMLVSWLKFLISIFNN